MPQLSRSLLLSDGITFGVHFFRLTPKHPVVPLKIPLGTLVIPQLIKVLLVTHISSGVSLLRKQKQLCAWFIIVATTLINRLKYIGREL